MYCGFFNSAQHLGLLPPCVLCANTIDVFVIQAFHFGYCRNLSFEYMVGCLLLCRGQWSLVLDGCCCFGEAAFGIHAKA